MHIIDSVPFISQLKLYPTGCESVSMAMLLRYYGFDARVEDIIDTCLPRGPLPKELHGVLAGPDPRYVFPGDPYSEDGYGCFAPAVRAALEAFLERFSPPAFTVREVYGASLRELCRDRIDRDIPVIVFATMGMAPPKKGPSWLILSKQGALTDRFVHWVSPMHCLLLLGHETGDDGETRYVFHDPTYGPYTRFSSSAAEAAYQAQGAQAVYLLPKKQ